MLLKAFELEQSQWLAHRCGTARQHIQNMIRGGFESAFMSHGGRWEMEKLRHALTFSEGKRTGRLNAGDDVAM